MSDEIRPLRDLSELARNRQIEPMVKRIREAVDDAGGPKAVARLCNVPLSTFSGYLSGREVKLSIAVRIADACGVSLEWLATGRDKAAQRTLQSQPDALSDAANINFFDEEVSAGFGRSGADAPKPQKIAISRQLLHDLGLAPHHTIMLKVVGDSMEPTLKGGDRLLLNTTPSHFLNGVTVFVSSGQLMVKRLAPTASGTVMIISDNDRYPTQEAEISRFRWGEPDGGDAITIIGRVAYRLQAMS